MQEDKGGISGGRRLDVGGDQVMRMMMMMMMIIINCGGKWVLCKGL